MKRWILWAILIILLLSLCPINRVSAAEGKKEPIVKVRHEIKVLRGGLVEVNDTFYIINTNLEPFREFTAYYPKEFFDKVTSLNITQKGTRLDYELYMPRGDLVGINVTLADPAEWEEEETVTIRAYVYYLFNSTGSDEFNATVPLNPTTPWGLKSCEVWLGIPRDGNFLFKPEGFTEESHGGFKYERGTLEDIPPYFVNMTTLHFSCTMPYLKCEKLHVKISVSPFGDVEVSETYKIANMGFGSVRNLVLKAPKDAYLIRVNDGFADMPVEVREHNDWKEVSPTLRAEIATGQKATLILSYKLPKSRITADPWALHYSLDYELLAWNNWTVDNFKLEVALPDGARISQLSPSFSLVSQEYACYEASNMTIAGNLKFHIEYDYSLAWAIVPYVGWLSFAIVVVLALSLIWKTVRPSPLPPVLPVDTISRFVDLYAEKVSLYDRIFQMDEDLEAKRVRKKEHREFVEKARREIERITRQLKELRKSVMKIDSTHANYVTSLEAAEAEINSVRNSMISLRTQRRLGRISKDAYERLMRDYKSRLKKARSTIDKILSSLREEIT